LVQETALKDLSPVDREFLLAMVGAPGPSPIAGVAERMGRPTNYVAVYRARLLKAGLIQEAGWGAVDLALPFLREYRWIRLRWAVAALTSCAVRAGYDCIRQLKSTITLAVLGLARGR
jgi:hypothetical protein